MRRVATLKSLAAVSVVMLYSSFALTAYGGYLFTGPFGPGGTYNLYEVFGVSGAGSPMSWYDAHLDASSRVDPIFGTQSGHLASIHSGGENRFVHAITGFSQPWIGLTDNESLGGTEAGSDPNGGWVWTSGEPYSFQLWNAGEPTDSTAAGEDAVHLLSLANNGRWTDRQSAIPGSGQVAVELPYVVEYEFNSPTPVPMTSPPVRAPGLIEATLVAESFSTGGSAPTGEIHSESVSVFINPDQTHWIAWNRFPNLIAPVASRPGELFLGWPSLGIDDYVNVTVTNPDGISQTVRLDNNDGIGRPLGNQAVIFGAADTTPDVVRTDNFSSIFISDESGTHNGIFTTRGIYDFKFAFGNIGGPSGHSDVYLLVETVPEPSSITLAVLGLLGLVACGRRHRDHTERNARLTVRHSRRKV